MEDDDDQSTCIEPIISYYSPQTNRGVKEISNTKCKTTRTTSNPFNINISSVSSVNNTIMLPFVSAEGSIGADNSYKNNMNNSIPISKGNSSNNYYMKFDNTRNKTISSKSDNEQKNNDSINVKISNTYNKKVTDELKKTATFIPQRFSMNLPDYNSQEILNNSDHNYDSDNIRNYNKKYTEEIRDSIRTAKTKHFPINDDKMPSLFLKGDKYDKKNYNYKNIGFFKNKKRRKTQKLISKTNKMSLKKKDRAAMFFIEKSKSFGNEDVKRKSQSSVKRDKTNIKIEGNSDEKISKSNKNIENIKDDIKKNWTTKMGLVDKYKPSIKTDKKKI